MHLLLDNKSGKPIYEQIYSQIRDQILSGALREDDPLPSIRSLAKDLRISVITTKRAYEELERSGLLYTVAGKGCFVAPKNLELIREAHLRELESHIEQMLRLAAALNLSGQELLDMIRLQSEDP